jgi:hypothetical protein
VGKILAAVGGTGQEIALACLRLSHMAGLEMPRVFVFDSDSDTQRSERTDVPTRSEALKEVGRLIAKYTNHDPVNFVEPIERELHTENIRSLFSPFNQTSGAVLDLLALLTTRDQRERTRITEGFHGQPQVGAIVFADAVEKDRLRSFLAALDEETAKPAVNHSVAIVGGTAGGTGPGVMPVLAEKIERWRRELNDLDRKQRINISMLVHLPWFQLVDASPGDINVEGMDRNSACLVRFYSEELSRLADRVVLTALPNMISRCSNGPHHQPETLHYLNAFSGWLAAELLTESETRRKMRRGALYGMVVDDREPVGDLALTDDRAANPVPLSTAIDVTRLLVGCGEELSKQLASPDDISLPSELRALAARIGTGLERFVQRFGELTDGDRGVLNWLRNSCLSTAPYSTGRDRNDEQQLFRLPPGATDTSPRALSHTAPGLSKARHILLAQLLGAFRSELLGALEARMKEQSRAEPETLAASFYTTLRTSLIRKLK